MRSGRELARGLIPSESVTASSRDAPPRGPARDRVPRRRELTHDENTIPRFAFDRVRSGQPMPGVFEVPADAPIGPMIDDILLLVECSVEGEWEGQVLYLPL